jgi:iron complex transport system substrate-binding protein
MGQQIIKSKTKKIYHEDTKTRSGFRDSSEPRPYQLLLGFIHKFKLNVSIRQLPSEFRGPLCVLVSSWFIFLLSCSQPPAVPISPSPRIASTSPAGSELVLALGLSDHLVAVSKYDNDPAISSKPQIGDYQSIDWEKLSPLQPDYLIVQIAPDRLPADLQQRCDEQHIQLINVRLNTLADIFSELKDLGDELHEPDKAAQATADLRSQLDAVHARVGNLPAVRAVVAISDSGLSLAGPGTFLDDLLTIAGGQNAAGPDAPEYFSVDRERLTAMNPDVVIQLIPGGDAKPQVLAAAAEVWASMPDLPAVKNHRIVTITDWYAIQPGRKVADLAKQFADALHPQ